MDERPRSQELDALIGKRFDVLSNGFVRVVDYMGNEESVARAARSSYAGGTRSVRDDAALIRHLMREHHSGPVEFAELVLHVRSPLFVWAQWKRHRTASINERSGRFSEMEDDFEVVHPDAWRLQSKANKQGSEGAVPRKEGDFLSAQQDELHHLAYEVYQRRLDAGVAREQARIDLPQSMYTEAYWKMDAHNLLHFLRLRTDPHAQQEIRAYADIIGSQIVKPWMPSVWQAFLDFTKHAMTLSSTEVALVKLISSGDVAAAVDLVGEYGWLERGAGGQITRHGERADAESKLARLGLEIPWKELL